MTTALLAPIASDRIIVSFNPFKDEAEKLCLVCGCTVTTQDRRHRYGYTCPRCTNTYPSNTPEQKLIESIVFQ